MFLFKSLCLVFRGDIEPKYVYRWPTVRDAGPTLGQRDQLAESVSTFMFMFKSLCLVFMVFHPC